MNEHTSPTLFSRFKTLPFTKKLLFFETILIVAVIVSSYTYWQVTTENRQQVQKNLQYIETLQQEKTACAQLIQKPEGNFSRFEYCKQLLEKFQ